MRKNVKVIGAGGIGGWLIQPLCQVLNYGSALYDFEGANLAIIDGDEYEERNRDRQSFKKRGNKAEVTADEIKDEFPNVNILAHPLFVTKENMAVLFEEGDTIFLGVDNHKTRKLISDYCAKMQDVTLISAGNDLTDGNLQVFIRKDGESLSPTLDRYHKEIENPQDEHPDEAEVKEDGCIEMVVTAPQLLITNFAAASLMLNAFHGILTAEKGLPYNEAYFDINVNKVRTELRPI